MSKVNQAGMGSKRLLVPPGRRLSNWLVEYLRFTEESEAPMVFHVWCGLGAISAALGRQVWMDFHYFEIHSNLFLVLVAPPGTARKSTALKIARRLVKKVPGLHMAPQAVTPEAVIKKMAEMAVAKEPHQSMTAYSLEMGTLLGKGAKQDSIIDFLTDIFDCTPDFDKETIGRGEERIPAPWFSLNAATQPDWIKDHMSPSALETGFVSRIIWVYADQRKLSNPLPEPSEWSQKLHGELVNDLTHISTLKGQATLSPDAKDFYKKWYMNDDRFPKSIDSRMGGYYERKHVHLLKVALLLCVAMSDSLVVEVSHLESALEFLADVEPGMHKAFVSVGKNPFSTDLERIHIQVTEAGEAGVTYSTLMAANYHALSQDELDKQLRQLTAMRRITIKPGNLYVIRGK